MKTKKSKEEKKLAKKYKAMIAKGNYGNTAVKTGIDLILGATLGAGIGATTGRLAIPVGLLLIAGSHFFEEDTGVVRTTGSAAIAYGIAKAIANQNLAENEAVNGFTLAGETSKAKVRLESFKDELFAAFFINKLLKEKKQTNSSTDQSVGSIDLSDLDFIERQLEEQANQFDQANTDSLQAPDEMGADLTTLEFDTPELDLTEYPSESTSTYTLPEEPDLTNI